MPGKSDHHQGKGRRRWVGDGGRRGRLQSVTVVAAAATAARRRRRLGKEELHFGNAGEVRSRSGQRRMAMGQGKWSEMKALVGHNGGGNATATRRRRQSGEEELHFRNAREVRPRSGRRMTAMGRGRWSKMKAPVNHSGGGDTAAQWWLEEEGSQERKSYTSGLSGKLGSGPGGGGR